MDVPPDLYELYAEFGMAAEKAQVLEVEAGNVGLAFLAIFVKPGERITEERREFFRQIVEDANRQNLGKLLRVVKSIGTYSNSMITTIDKALERRNYLTHHFFRTHNFAICNALPRLQDMSYGEGLWFERIMGEYVRSPESIERLKAFLDKSAPRVKPKD